MRKNRMTTRPHQEGSVLIASLIMLLVLSVFAVIGSSLTAGGYDAYSLNAVSTQALYAADSGVEMGLMEYASNCDVDGDGTIGGISDDGDDGTDPLIGGASLSVTFVDSVFTAAAEKGRTRRVVEVTIE